MNDVAVVPCDSYEISAVENALKEALEQTGGLDFVKPGMKIVIKANLVTAMKPDAAATPHPSVVCALVKMLLEKGAQKQGKKEEEDLLPDDPFRDGIILALHTSVP